MMFCGETGVNAANTLSLAPCHRLTIALVFALFPIFWMVSTSFKPTHEWAATPPVWITSNPTLANYSPLIEVDFNTGWVDGNGAS